MKHTVTTTRFHYPLFTFLFILSFSATSQDTAVHLVPVTKPFIERGKECFKVNIRSSRRDKRTEQVSVNYNTLKRLLDDADPDSNIVFFLVAIDKDYAGSEAVWGNLNGKTGPAGMETLNNKQALIVKISNKTPAPAAYNPERNSFRHDVYSGSSLKNLNKTYMPYQSLNKTTETRLGLWAGTSSYYALGRLCPPPECPGY